MYQSVRDAFYGFNAPFEGVVHWMYLDVKGLVTIGVGNLIDPVNEARRLPFEYEGNPGSRASQDEIAAAWQAVKDRQDLKMKSYKVFQSFNNLRLSDESIAALIEQRLMNNEAFLMQHHFSNFENWPADAQLGCLSMAWAMGANFPQKFPKFKQACLEEDWSAAETNCTINETGNPGVKPRNAADRTLFANAARVVEQGLDPATLYYPTILLAEVITTPEGETEGQTEEETVEETEGQTEGQTEEETEGGIEEEIEGIEEEIEEETGEETEEEQVFEPILFN